MTTNARRLVVVDASIAIKWFLNDEDHVAEALVILAAIGTGELLAIAPDHIRYEVSNALRTAVRTNRITITQAIRALDELENLDIPMVNDHQLLRDGLDVALRLGCAFDDGLYLALSERTVSQVVHADRRLRNTINARFPREVWIDDFSM